MSIIIIDANDQETTILKLQDETLTLSKIDKSNNVTEKITLKKIRIIIKFTNILINHIHQHYANESYATKKLFGGITKNG